MSTTVVKPYVPKNKIRAVTAASLFDGHDAVINIMRRIVQTTFPSHRTLSMETIRIVGLGLSLVFLSCSVAAQLQVEWSGKVEAYPQNYGSIGSVVSDGFISGSGAVDQWGNSFVAGGVLTGPDNGVQVSGPEGILFIVDSTGDRRALLARYNAAGDPSWAFRIGEVDDWPVGLTTDGSGAVYLAGRLENAMDVDPGPDSTVISRTDNDEDRYIAKYDSMGHFQHVIHFRSADGTPTYTYITRMACDAMNNLYVIGGFTGKLVLDNDQTVISSNGTWQCAFVAAYDSNGQLLQYLRLPASPAASISNDLVLTDDGGIFITGRFENSIDLDPGPGTANLNNDYGTGFFMARYDDSFGLIWARTFSGGMTGMGKIACKGKNGGFIVSGNFRGEANIEVDGVITQYQTGWDWSDNFLMGISATGDINWFRQFPTSAPNYFMKLCAMDDNTFYAGLSYSGSFNLDPGLSDLTVTTASPFPDYDMGFAQYSMDNGDFLMSHIYPPPAGIYLDLNSLNGALFVTADFQNEISIGVPSDGELITESASGALAVIKYVSPNAGIRPLKNHTQLIVHPVPASFTIQVEGGDEAQGLKQLIVLDGLGKIVVDQTAEGEREISISVKELSNGLYVLHAIFSDGHIARSKFMVAH